MAIVATFEGPASRLNPIDGDDVADAICRQLDAPLAGNQELSIGGQAAESLGRQARLRIRTIPIAVLQVMAALSGVGGKFSRRLRRSAALLHWMIYVGTHNAVAPCVGRRHLRDAFAAKCIDLSARESAVLSLKACESPVLTRLA